jgi:DNA-binding transcriptional regulator LsrR (DeoR family)
MKGATASTGPKRNKKAVLTAAYLKCLSQTDEEISAAMEVAQPTVSRYVADARRRGWLRLSLNTKDIPQGLLAAVREELHGAPDLHKRVRTWGGRDVTLRVFYSGKEDIGSEGGYRIRLARFAKAAAPFIAELLPSMKKTGVAWGRTLRAVVDALRDAHESGKRWANEGLEFVPVVGQPLNYPTADCGASRLVDDLHRWAGCKGRAHSIESVAACIPLSHAKHKQTVLSLHRRVRTYAKVFGDPHRAPEQTPYINQLNCILTSVGTKHLSDDWIVDAAEAANISEDQLHAITVGNISGVFLPRPNAGAQGRASIEEINGRGTGIKLRHLKECAKTKPGVVILALGAEKAEIIRACLIKRTISHLFVDQDLKNALLRLDG